MKVEGRAKKGGKGQREDFVSFLSFLLHHIFFALFPTHNKQTRERLLRRILVHEHDRLFNVLEDQQYI